MGSSRPWWAITRRNVLLFLIVLVGLIALAGIGAYASGALDSVLPGTCTIGQTGDAATVTIEGVGARHACSNAAKPSSYGGPGIWFQTTPSTTQLLCSYKVGNLKVTVRWSQSTVGLAVCESPFDPANFDPHGPTVAASYTCLSGHCGPVPQPTPAPIAAPTPYGWIVVTATDPQSNPLTGITASLAGTTSTAVTDVAGHAYVEVPEPGSYKLEIRTATPMYFCTSSYRYGFHVYDPNSPLHSANDSVTVVLATTSTGC